MANQEFIDRLRKAIDDSAATQQGIADYCDVSKQSVNNWKRNGRISVDNLKRVAEVTGYRYAWIKDGTGEMLASDRDQEEMEFRLSESGSAYVVVSEALAQSPAVTKLLNNLTYAYANRHISEEAIEHLAAFVGTLGEPTQ